jgi:beta-glucuronidase
MISRRKLLSGAPLLGAASVLTLPSAWAADEEDGPHLSAGEVLPLEEGWHFRLDAKAAAAPAELAAEDAAWQPVTVPHTWQSLGGSPEYAGVAWYRRKLFAPAAWQSQFVRVEFEAVYHTAHVFLNGTPVGEHIGKGYTAFTCDLSPQLRYDAANELHVRVDNSFSNTMLPRMKSFDWANDGGLIRPVQLLVTPPVFIERVEIDAVPDLEKNVAEVTAHAVVRNTLPAGQRIQVSASIRGNAAGPLEHGHAAREAELAADSRSRVQLGPMAIESPELWHFDRPRLYRLEATIEAGGRTHTRGESFGIRKFEIRGAAFYLNGEHVALMGVERMAGSHPQFGMAEPREWIDANHRDMKELNCVFSRVHWPQDKRVLDFCDRHGILMQEEVPAWGGFTFAKNTPELQAELTRNGLEQLREMVGRDRNHPCIVSWGLCNEVDGKNPNSRAFADRLAEEARRIDPERLLTYASSSLHENPGEDMAGDFDFISINEYYGSWTPGGLPAVRAYIERIQKAFPGKPLVISEYGWCECQPRIPPGDENRVGIINGHTEVYREFPHIAGAIYFDYNDYRTQMGDKGTGALLQRVHGVVDLYADRKPSFAALRGQASPIGKLTLDGSGADFSLQIETRRELPAYVLRGYAVRWLFYGYDDLAMDGKLQPLEALAPGQSVTVQATSAIGGLRRVVADVLRPTGYSAGTAEMQL